MKYIVMNKEKLTTKEKIKQTNYSSIKKLKFIKSCIGKFGNEVKCNLLLTHGKSMQFIIVFDGC